MLDNLMRLREPAAWTVLAVTAVSIVLAVVRFVLELTAGAGLAAAAQGVALQAMNLTLVIVVVALVWSCVFHAPTPGAARVVTAAVAVVTTGTLLTVAGALLGLPASAGALAVVLELLGGLLDIVLKIVGVVTLWLILRGLRGGRIDLAPALPATASAPAPAPAAPEASVPDLPPPTWAPDAAAGTAWTSASDAASGARPSGFGVPGEASGWHAVRRPPGGDEADAGDQG